MTKHRKFKVYKINLKNLTVVGWSHENQNSSNSYKKL